MKKIFRLSILLFIFTLLFVPTHAAQAQGPNPDGGGQVIFGSNYTVKSGDTFEGDLVVFGGNVIVEENASLKGDLVVFGGTVTSNGEVSGSIVVVGGQISLEKSARVAKDVVMIGSQLNKDDGAVVKGTIVNNAAPNISVPPARIPPTAPEAPSVPPVISFPNVHINYNPFGEFIQVFGFALFVSFLGILATLFFHDHLGRVSQAVVSQPLMTGSIGLLSIAAILLTAITIIGIPLAFLGTIVLIFAWLFGVISMGQEIGDRLAKAFRQDWTPIIATGLGTFVLVFVVASFQSVDSLLPFIGCVTWIIPVLVGLVAVGAVVITRFGTQPAPASGLTIYTRPPTNSGPDVPVG